MRASIRPCLGSNECGRKWTSALCDRRTPRRLSPPAIECRVAETTHPTCIQSFALQAPPVALEKADGAPEAERLTLQSELATLKGCWNDVDTREPAAVSNRRTFARR